MSDKILRPDKNLAGISEANYVRVCWTLCDAQTSLASMESKQSLAENDLRQMRTNLRDYEVLVEDYRTQVCISVYCIVYVVVLPAVLQGASTSTWIPCKILWQKWENTPTSTFLPIEQTLGLYGSDRLRTSINHENFERIMHLNKPTPHAVDVMQDCINDLTLVVHMRFNSTTKQSREWVTQSDP